MSVTPSRIVISFRVGFALAVANVLCAAVVAWAWIRVAEREQVISVKGSAKSRIQSDLIRWKGTVSTGHANLQQAYQQLKEAMEKTSAYLKSSGLAENEFSTGFIRSETYYQKDWQGHNTEKVSMYRLLQDVEVTSTKVSVVANLSRRVTDLMEQGVLFESHPPEYIYTKLSDLKIALLASATQDARNRARQICDNSGSNLGPVRLAHMGVMQVVPANSTEVSDSGINDTSSLDKDAMAVVSVNFAVR